MSSSLFTLEDEFVSSLCFGMSDKETTARFVDALEAGRREVQREVRDRVRRSDLLADRADEVTVALIEGHYVVLLPDDIADEALDDEYGTDEEPPKPLLRQSVQQTRVSAAKAITKKLELT